MLQWARETYAQLVQQIELIEKQETELDIQIDRRQLLIIEAISGVKNKIRDYHFESDMEEILFYKTCLPDLIGLYIYYAELLEFETIEIIGTPKSKQEFTDKEFQKIDDFFKQNMEFYRYYRSGRTNLDKDYFLRNSDWNNHLVDILAPLLDSTFCTIYTFKIGSILAYNRLEQFLQDPTIKRRPSSFIFPFQLDKLEWTDPKQGLIELIYALKEKGAFNDGKADLYRITGYFEEVFSIKLGNISSNFQKVLSRKTGYTNYIDKLKDKLLGRIDEIEDKHIK